MTSRLDKLFILLETGTNTVTKRAAAQQLGEVQRLHPHELHHLLARVSILLKSPEWDTRICAAHAIQAIISQVPVWNPEPLKEKLLENEIKESATSSKPSYKLSLDNFDINYVLTQSSYLTGSEGSEYDSVAVEGDTALAQNDKLLAVKLGLHPQLMGVDTADLYTVDESTHPIPTPARKQKSEKIPVKEVLRLSVELSRREINHVRRKSRHSISKHRPRESEDSLEVGDSSNSMQCYIEPNKKIKLEDGDSSETRTDSSSVTGSDLRHAIPDGTGCWPDSAIDWPLEAFADNLLCDIFSMKWEVRHGAATALRELIRLHGGGAGKSRNQTLEEMEDSHRGWMLDAALRLLCVLGIDRFGDFISDQVVAPVRETCAQALGFLIALISKEEQNQCEVKITNEKNGQWSKGEQNNEEKVIRNNGMRNTDIMSLLSVMFKLLEHNDWEARHGALLALKYFLAIRSDLLKEIVSNAFPAIMKGLSDSVEDVGAAAANALTSVAPDLPRLLDSEQLEAIVSKLWEMLKEQDDVAATCKSFMGLLAAILSSPATRVSLTLQSLSLILPRLWAFLNHSNSSVREATLQTLNILIREDCNTNLNPMERWGENGAEVLREILHNVFQRVLVEHIARIQAVAELIWINLVTQSDLELLLLATCPLVSTWLCLAMQPEQVPFNSNMLMNITPHKLKNADNSQGENQASTRMSETKSSMFAPDFKVYIGGIETIAQRTRHFNVVRARCMATRMLGLLSSYLVKTVPGLIYSPEIPSSLECYTKLLLAHLMSKSAMQRTISALTIAHWAAVVQENLPTLPEILQKQLVLCLNECIYYEEIATLISSLSHDWRDYKATLERHKISPHVEENANDMVNLEQIATLTSAPIPGTRSTTPNISNSTIGKSPGSSATKLDAKLLQNLEERRCALKTRADALAAQQQALHVTVMAAVSGAAIMWRCLPEVSEPLNPLIKPLMESIKKEKDEELQNLTAKHLAHLVKLCVQRKPCPNAKIAANLCTFLCSDTEFSPRVMISDVHYEPFSGILTLSNRQKQTEELLHPSSTGSVSSTSRLPGNDTPVENMRICEDVQVDTKTTRRGAVAALTAIAILLGTELPELLPELWDLMLPKCLRNYKIMRDKLISAEEAQQLVFSLQILEVMMPSIDKSHLMSVMECLDSICVLLTNVYKTVRHMASRCIAVLASLNVKETMNFVVSRIVKLLGTGDVETDGSSSTMAPSKIEACRQGAAEALACIVQTLGINIVPFAVFFIVPLLGRMSDKNSDVRLCCSETFATLIQLLPLDTGAIDSSCLEREKALEYGFVEQLLNPCSIPDTPLPISVAAELRSYQQQGLNWLDFLNRYQLHGVLCDDMGLGKTLQTLCIIALDHHRNKQAPSSLVICPPTLTGHWINEAEKFFQIKDLSVIQYVGIPIERTRLRSKVTTYKLVIASYDIVRKDIEFFKTAQWNYCVLDEGHVIKNGKTKSAKAVKKIIAHHRLILSGTPVQNDVLELWSLFDFLMPGFLGSERQFSNRYSKPILACREPKAGSKEQEAAASAMEVLHRQVLPFILRRNKEDVLKDLPPKIMQDYYCDLSVLQKTLYEDFKLGMAAGPIGNVSLSNNPQRGHVFEALRYLRNVCNHPKLVLSAKHPQYRKVSHMLNQQHSNLADIQHSAKLVALKQLLLDCGIGDVEQSPIMQNSVQSQYDIRHQAQLVSQHRALIFCQLKAMLDIVEHDLLRTHLSNVTYLRLDGTVPAAQRHSVVTRFNNDPSIDVLLLTTQVGGLGLNLTGADTIIFIEHDWNPMRDLQAMDRAHRIGQKKVVNVYRLITRQTIEERIMGLQKFKIRTANTIISADNASLNTMKTEQLLDLFSLDGDKKVCSNNVPRNKESGQARGESGINQSVLEILPELWEQQQYDDEYDLDSFLMTLKSNNA